MNCKQGDLAFLVTSSTWPEAVGRVFRCVSYDPDHTGDPAWRVDPPIGRNRIHEGIPREGNWVYDYCLRPIRPDGITDEEVRELYLTKQKEAA